MKQESILPGSFQARVPVVGTLKIGDVDKQGDKARPKKLDYMRLCGPSATAGGTYPDHPAHAEFNKGKKTSITIELVSDDPRVNLDLVYTMAGRGSVLCRGNGETAERRVDARGSISPDVKFQKLPEGSCGEKCAFFANGQCKLASTLRFRIPGTPIGATWQFRSMSWNSAQDLLGAQEEIKALTGGTLARLPIKLFMQEQARKAITDKGRTSTTFYSLGLAFDGDEDALIAAVARSKKLQADMAAVSIPSLEERLKAQGPDLLADLSPAEELAIAAEFFPGLPTTLAAEGGPAEAQAEASETSASGEGAPESVDTATETASAPAAPEPLRITESQRGLLLKHSSRIPGLDRKALEALLARPVADGGLTKKAASDLIAEVLADAAKAFANLGVVA